MLVVVEVTLVVVVVVVAVVALGITTRVTTVPVDLTHTGDI